MPAQSPETVEVEKRFLDMLVGYEGPLATKEARRKFAKDAYAQLEITGNVSAKVRNILCILFKNIKNDNKTHWIRENGEYSLKFDQIVKKIKDEQNKANDGTGGIEADPNLEMEEEDGDDEDSEPNDENVEPVSPQRKSSLAEGPQDKWENGDLLQVVNEEVIESEEISEGEENPLNRSGHCNGDGTIPVEVEAAVDGTEEGEHNEPKADAPIEADMPEGEAPVVPVELPVESAAIPLVEDVPTEEKPIPLKEETVPQVQKDLEVEEVAPEVREAAPNSISTIPVENDPQEEKSAALNEETLPEAAPNTEEAALVVGEAASDVGDIALNGEEAAPNVGEVAPEPSLEQEIAPQEVHQDEEQMDEAPPIPAAAEPAPPVNKRRQNKKRKPNGQVNAAPAPKRSRRTADAIIVEQAMDVDNDDDVPVNSNRRRSPRGLVRNRISVPPPQTNKDNMADYIPPEELRRRENEAAQGEATPPPTAASISRNSGRRPEAAQVQGAENEEAAHERPPIPPPRRASKRPSVAQAAAQPANDAEQEAGEAPPGRVLRRSTRGQSVGRNEEAEVNRKIFKVTPGHCKKLEENLIQGHEILRQIRLLKARRNQEEQAVLERQRQAPRRNERASSVARNAGTSRSSRSRSEAPDSSPQNARRTRSASQGPPARRTSARRAKTPAPRSATPTHRARTPAPSAPNGKSSTRPQPSRAGSSPSGYPNMGPAGRTRSRSLAPSSPEQTPVTPKKTRK